VKSSNIEVFRAGLQELATAIAATMFRPTRKSRSGRWLRAYRHDPIAGNCDLRDCKGGIDRDDLAVPEYEIGRPHDAVR
jgi:hypothetical protein